MVLNIYNNTTMLREKILDEYESVIWTERYNEYGDFEIYLPVSNNILDSIKMNYYLENVDSEHTMIIEDIQVFTDAEVNNYYLIKGRSLESILDRRIVWGLNTISGNLQNGINTLLNNSIINPSISYRKINNFIFESSTDPKITSLTLDAQFTGDNLYEVITEICKAFNIGFKVTLNDNNQFVFKLYAGVDRSYDQVSNPYVIFSPNFENLINSKYIESNRNLKNVTLIGGEGEGNQRRYTTYGLTSSAGLNRREFFTDARDVSSKAENNTTIPDAQYIQLLQQRGKEKLSEYKTEVVFEAEADPNIMFLYGKDYYKGDIVQLENEYGYNSKGRITEYIRVEDVEGERAYPTFSLINEEI